MSGGPAKKTKAPTFSPWALFGVFLLSNSLLSYAEIPLAWKIWIGVMGVALPFTAGLYFPVPPRRPLTALQGEWIPSPPPWVWLSLALSAAALRLFKPLTFFPWPLPDEAVNGYFAIQLDQQWTWSPFFFYSQLPPLFIWLLALLYKTAGSMLAAIRLEPILLSLLILPAAYAAARSFFSRSFSLLYLAMTAFGFWALFFGRISHQGLLLVLWEYGGLAVLGRVLKASGRRRWAWLSCLGLLLGGGFYTYFSWPLVAVWVGVMAWLGLAGKKGRVPSLLSLLVPAAVILAPLLVAVWDHGYGNYFRLLWSLKSGNDWWLQAQNTLSCLGSFLWGHAGEDFYYGPVWGGFLNPVVGAAFLLGLMDLIRGRGRPESKAFFIGVPLFMAPAFLTNTLTDMREIQVLPLMAFAAAAGAGTLAEKLPSRKKVLFLGAFLLASTALDLTHLARFEAFVGNFLESHKTAENARAFRLLQQVQQKEGPGIVLTTYGNDLYTYDLSLPVAAYPFNAAMNPRLSPAQARWLAVVANIHFLPFLKREFPEAQTAWLSEADRAVRDNYNGGLMLAVIPLAPSNLPRLGGWVEMDQFLRGLSGQVMGLPTEEARREIRRALSGELAKLPEDRFLRSCYWEMVYLNYSWENLYGNRDFQSNFPAAVSALQRGIVEGYPTAYFYNELGSCYALAGEYPKARRAFEKAVQAPLNLTPAADNLKALGAMKKNSIQGETGKGGAATR